MSDGRDYLRDMWTRNTTNDGVVNSQEEFKKRAKLISEDDLEHMPNQKMHRNISFVKSGMRLIACGLGMLGYVSGAFALLFMAEIVGIYEEMV